VLLAAGLAYGILVGRSSGLVTLAGT
jgi:hypothetical protein